MNGILGDEMGLGKTIQCISVIAYMIGRGVPGPFLIAAPLSTVPNWVSEFKRFTPKVRERERVTYYSIHLTHSVAQVHTNTHTVLRYMCVITTLLIGCKYLFACCQ